MDSADFSMTVTTQDNYFVLDSGPESRCAHGKGDLLTIKAYKSLCPQN